MSLMNSKRNEYKKILKEYEKKSKTDKQFYLLSSSIFKKVLNNKQLDDKDLDFYYDLCKEWDQGGNIPLELGNYIENSINNKKIVFGIYKFYTDVYIDHNDTIHSDIVNEIFYKGLDNYSNNKNMSIPEPSKVISPVNNIIEAVRYIKSNTDKYNVAILVGLPSKYVDKSLCIKEDYEEEIYNITGSHNFIKPKYLLGLIYQKNGNCCYFIKEKVDKSPEIEII